MDAFVSRFPNQITGVLSGFDRLVFRGHLTPLRIDGGMFFFLQAAGVRLLDFRDYVVATSEAVKERSLAQAERQRRPVRYLESSATSKEDLARTILLEHPVERGLICAFKTVEPCVSFEYHRSKDKAERGLRLRPAKCLHLYKYFLDPTFGFMSVRLQTWFPFDIQVCLNGREWLGRQLQRRGVRFLRNDNCFPWLDDVELAQRLMDRQLDTDWPGTLRRIARSINPLHDRIFAASPMDYYWVAHQTEWATDTMSANPRVLAAIYPPLVQHAMNHFGSPDVMRFLGKKAHGNFLGELVTSFKDRAEGVRVKHWVAGNSIKMYDKAGSVLRVETTIAQTQPFKVLRPTDDERPDAKLAWLPLRKGVADLHRRAAVSQRANDHYLTALAAVDDTTPLAHVFDQVARRVMFAGRTARALHIGDRADVSLLAAIARGEFATAGFRNRDLRGRLAPTRHVADRAAQRRQSAKIGRQIRLLRAHGLVRKVQRSHRYELTPRGHLLAAAVFAMRAATTQQLLRPAA